MLIAHQKNANNFKMQSQTFYIINQYASTPATGIGGRHYYLAKELAKRGHKVFLIASSFTHLLHKPPKFTKEYKIQKIDGFNFIWIKMPTYSNAHSLKRVVNWFKFSMKLLNLYKIILPKPNSILFSSPSTISFVAAYFLSKKFKAKLVWDIRDLWPLTLIELGKFSKFNPFIIFLSLIELFAIKKSDFIISNWPYAIKYLLPKGANKKKFSWIPNGYSEDEFSLKSPIKINNLKSLPIKKFLVGYTGSLGLANAIRPLMYAAFLLRHVDDIKFILVGKGSLESEIKNFINLKKLKNIILLKPVPKIKIPSLLNSFDVCYVGFSKNPIYKYGNSLNKLPEYFMSGKPIIFSSDSTFQPVKEARAGITVPAENSKAIARAIINLKNIKAEKRKKLGKNGIKYAKENLSYKILSRKLEKILIKT